MNIDNWKVTKTQVILDWDPVEKGMVISYIAIVAAFWGLLLIGGLYGLANALDLPASQRISDFGFVYALIVGSLYAALCILAVLVGSRIRDAVLSVKQRYMHACMCIYVLGNILVAHIFGELSVVTGIIAAGAPIVGWILFDKKGVLLSFIAGFVGVTTSFSLSFFDLVPYAPIVDVQYGLYSNISYFIALMGVVIPHLLSLVWLANMAITHWQQREDHANYLAGIDSLTNIPNRRQVRQIFQQTISRSIAEDKPLSVAMFDLDHFKSINDKRGHHIGDQILNHFVNVIQKNLRSQYTIGRLGGDEFFVIMPHTANHKAQAISQNLLNQLRDSTIVIDEITFNVTASVGVMTLNYIHDTDAEINNIMQKSFIQVDRALYEAKQNGRNQVVSV